MCWNLDLSSIVTNYQDHIKFSVLLNQSRNNNYFSLYISYLQGVLSLFYPTPLIHGLTANSVFLYGINENNFNPRSGKSGKYILT